MKRVIIFTLLLTSGLACNFRNRENEGYHYTASSDTTETNALTNIRFDFTAERGNVSADIIEIKASLFNDNKDTVYFLSSTCEGEQYSLRTDIAGCGLATLINCNASYPLVVKIAPEGRHDFRANFQCDSNITGIKLGFDFYSIDKSFDLAGKTIGEINIFNRPAGEQTIIWADEQQIVKR